MWWFRHRVWKIHFSGWFWRAFKVVVEPLLDGCLGWIQGVASMLLSGCQGFCLRGLLECCWTVARLHTSWVVYFTCTLEECEIEFSCIMTKMYVFLLIGFMRPQQEMSNHTFTYCSKYNTRHIWVSWWLQEKLSLSTITAAKGEVRRSSTASEKSV